MKDRTTPGARLPFYISHSPFLIFHSPYLVSVDESMIPDLRLSTGVPGLDDHLGGGLLPGTLTVVVGSAGIGKTQLGLQFLHQGAKEEGRPGIIFDMSCRGDSQNHAEYARRMFGWSLQPTAAEDHVSPDGFFDASRAQGDYLHAFEHSGRRVTRRDLDCDAWQEWQAEVARRLNRSIAFFYGNFVRGVRRAVIDGIEPVDRPSESIQVELVEYIYHQVLRKDPEWVARDLFRENYRRNAELVALHPYDPELVGCLLLQTARETSLDALVERPLDEGDLLTNANTVLYMAKIREGTKFRRAMVIAKHRGSRAADDILPYRIEAEGIRLE
jgi:KaiC/GvpD/RAD55 family RecA-like ATPase